jgi:hypothetical protein
MKKIALLIVLISVASSQAMNYECVPGTAEEQRLCNEAFDLMTNARLQEIKWNNQWALSLGIHKILSLPIPKDASQEVWNYICNCMNLLLERRANPEAVNPQTNLTILEAVSRKGLVFSDGLIQKPPLAERATEQDESKN